MKLSYLAPFFMFLGYSLSASLMMRALLTVTPVLVVAVSISTLAGLAWVAALVTGEYANLSRMTYSQIGLVCTIGVLGFVGDVGFALSGALKVPPAITYAGIACVAMGITFFSGILAGTTLSKQEMFGIALCCVGGVVIYTAQK